MMRNLGMTTIILCAVAVFLCIRLIVIERRLDRMQDSIEHLIMDIEEHGERILDVENRVTTMQILHKQQTDDKPVPKDVEVKTSYAVAGLARDWRK